ncbi:segregation/condensation protein A [Aerococcaceae bacterium DSM 111020]|nr:segregation/condensation protein A [Aerococcaceae bacterium DSM 111020]
MTEITEQYLAYIKQMQEYELNIIGDYLVMAATLLEIKSKLLLPIEPAGEIEEDYEEDPRFELVQQLLLYQQFQSVADELEDMSDSRQKSYTRPMADLSSYTQFVPLEENEITMTELTTYFEHVLLKFQQRNPTLDEIQTEDISVGDQIHYLQECLKKSKTIAFSQTLESGTRPEIISTFLAMLELVRKNQVLFKQEERAGEIYMMRVEK